MNKYDFRCEICQGKFDSNYNIPKVLCCGHTVCSKCIDRMKDKNINRCPFDRKLIDYDEDKIAINYYILQLIDGSIKENTLSSIPEQEEVFKLDPKPVINSPGWKNSLSGFINGDILYTVESNGFIYCTDLNSGEWWFLYLNQFYGKYLFQAKGKFFIIDLYGNLYQLNHKNYYTQIGKKNSWRDTSYLTILNDKLYTIETSNRLYETDLESGRWKEIGKKKPIENQELMNKKEFVAVVASESNEEDNAEEDLSLEEAESVGSGTQAESNFIFPKADSNFDGVCMLTSNSKNLLMSNRKGEFYIINELTGELKLIKNDFSKNIEAFAFNSTHLYFLEKNSKTLLRSQIDTNSIDSLSDIFEKMEIANKEDVSNNYFSVEKYTELADLNPIKLIADDEKVVIFDKNGDLNVFNIKTKALKPFKCFFMLRNCHFQNTCLMGDGYLLILDPIRLSINKLNIVNGSEIILLHSLKFIYSIRTVFANNSKIYFIDITGNLYYFNESEKKVNQIGNNGICKYLNQYVTHKNYLFTIENSCLYRTSLVDGSYVEIKNDFMTNVAFIFADNVYIIFISKEDDIIVTVPSDMTLKLKKKFNYPGISQTNCITYFKNHIVTYKPDTKTIDSLSLEGDELVAKTMVEDFPDVYFFVNNNDVLACVLKEGFIYKLFC
jgi:hypothetical protein